MIKLKIDDALEYTVIEKRATSDPHCMIAVTVEAGQVAISRPDRPAVFDTLQEMSVPFTAYVKPQEMPPVTVDYQLQLEHRRRQKQKMLVGRARQRIEAGDQVAALAILLEAIEPTEDQVALDAKIKSAE